jgi:hypothetical protein
MLQKVEGLVLAVVIAVAGASVLSGCGESCEQIAEQACASYLNEDPGSGRKYDTCYRQSLAECGHSGG